MLEHGTGPTEEAASRAAKLGAGLRILALVAVVVVFARRQLDDFDLPWNLAQGRLIVQGRAIPRIDELAFTRGPLQYVEVLGDSLLYLVGRASGARGLQVLGGLVAAGCFAVTHLRSRSAGHSSFAWTAWFAVAVAPWFTVRPATISLLFLALVLAAVEEHQSKGRLAPLVAMVPLCFVWANVHGLVALGVLLLLLYAGTRVVTAIRTGRVALRAAGVVAAISVAAAAVASINTLGPRLLLGTHRGEEVLIGITEWERPTREFLLNQVPACTSLLIAAGLAVLLGREPDGKRLPSGFDAAVTIGATAAYFVATRFIPLALVVLTPIAARRAARWFPPGAVLQVASAVLPLSAAAFLFLSTSSASTAGFDAGRLPVDAAGFVRSVRPKGQMYNFMPFGGYLAYSLYPDYQVFTDGRNTHARSPAFVRRASAAGFEPAVFEASVSEYRLEWAVTTSVEGKVFDRPLAAARDWTMIYLDDVSAIYVRRQGPNADLASNGYRYLRHLISAGSVLEAAFRAPPGLVAAALAHDGALALEQDPDSARACFLAAAGGLAAGDEAAFRRALRRLADLAPLHPALPALREAWAAKY